VSKEPVSTKVPPERREAIDEWADETGRSRSQAIDRLCEVGLREVRGPLLYRVRRKAMDAALYLCMTAATLIALGGVTRLLAMGQAVTVGTVIVAMAMVPLALLELAKLARQGVTFGDGTGVSTDE